MRRKGREKIIMLTNDVTSSMRCLSKQEPRGKRNQLVVGAAKGLGLPGQRSTAVAEAVGMKGKWRTLSLVGPEKGGLHQFKGSRW